MPASVSFRIRRRIAKDTFPCFLERARSSHLAEIPAHSSEFAKFEINNQDWHGCCPFIPTTAEKKEAIYDAETVYRLGDHRVSLRICGTVVRAYFCHRFHRSFAVPASRDVNVCVNVLPLGSLPARGPRFGQGQRANRGLKRCFLIPTL